MKRYGLRYALVIVGGLVVIAGGLALLFSNFLDLRGTAAPAPVQAQPVAAIKTPQVAKAGVAYNPPKPEDAPKDINDAVMLGYNILTNTKQYAADYTSNDLNCSNCHFQAGMTQGGKNGGISLVGVAAVYPKFRSRQNYAVNMVTRINDCFVRSQNGKPLPADSKEMTAMITYFQWIAKDIPIYADVPWLGLPKLKSTAQDKAAGQQVYTAKCTACHGDNGQGTAAAPALWGDRSYNDGAGMATPATLAAFAFNNMPRGAPTLTEDEASNLGAFIDGQTRPHFQK